jgi:hypothetical protein
MTTAEKGVRERLVIGTSPLLNEFKTCWKIAMCNKNGDISITSIYIMCPSYLDLVLSCNFVAHRILVLGLKRFQSLEEGKRKPTTCGRVQGSLQKCDVQQNVIWSRNYFSIGGDQTPSFCFRLSGRA